MSSVEQQKNCKHRARIMAYWNSMKNKQLSFHMINGVIVTAVLLAVKGDQSRFLVQDLQTPIGKYSNALLRSEDIAYIETKN